MNNLKVFEAALKKINLINEASTHHFFSAICAVKNLNLRRTSSITTINKILANFLCDLKTNLIHLILSPLVYHFVAHCRYIQQ